MRAPFQGLRQQSAQSGPISFTFLYDPKSNTFLQTLATHMSVFLS